jgi:16S rRNA processing protein RimM
MNAPLPADALAVGYIAGAFGIKGWIKIQPFSLDATGLLASATWWLTSDTPRPKPLPPSLQVLSLRAHGNFFVAQIDGVNDRAEAEALRGATVQVPRSCLPKTPDGEFYWMDLIGLSVQNLQGECVGSVIGLIDTGPHCVLRIAPPGVEQPSLAQEILIPFVSRYGCDVSLADQRITVDWQLDWSDAE